MAWFDGTFSYSDEKLNEQFPVEITPALRTSADGRKLALVNAFAADSWQLALSDPKVGEEDGAAFTFYHTFTGHDAAVARQAIEAFLAVYDENDGESVTLLRREADRLFRYAHGHIRRSLLHEQDALRALIPATDEDVFLLPLKRYMHRCPVCGHRTLSCRACFEICTECGWEDEGFYGDDEEPVFGANGDYTIRQYRERYLKRKAKDPNYTWQGEFDERMGKL